MSQPQPPQPQFVQPATPFVMVQAPQRNGLGVFGFLVALIGLAIPTGIVSLLGLMLSLVAVGRAPRGFAAMGVIFGLIGSAFWLVLTFLAMLGIVAIGVVAAVSSGAMFMISQPETVELTTDMVNVMRASQVYHDREQRRAGSLEDLQLGAATRLDPWGRAYQYELVVDDPGFELISSGPDGTFATDDDVRLSRLDRLWEDAFEHFAAEMETIGEQLEAMERSGSFQRMFGLSCGGSASCGSSSSTRVAALPPASTSSRDGDDYESRAAEALAREADVAR